MDLRALIGEVAARTHIRLDEDDPAFALVTLNQLVLERTVAELLQQVRATMTEFEQSTTKLQGRLGGLLANELRRALVNAPPDRKSITVRSVFSTACPSVIWVSTCAGLGGFVLGCFVAFWIV